MSYNDVLNKYHHFEEEINLFSIHRFLEYLKDHEIDINKGQYSTILIFELLNINPKYHKFIIYALSVLKDFKLIKNDNDKIQFDVKNDCLETDKRLDDIKQKYPEYSDIANFVQHCTQYYSAVFTGSMRGVSVVYPSADVNFVKPVALAVEQVYCIEYQRRLIKKLLSSLSNKNKLSVLEVGAGVGLITWEIMPSLNQKNINYTFSDISRFFIAKAKKRAKLEKIDCMDFMQFDISKKPAPQGLSEASYDFILAINVIHATENIATSLENLKKVLRPGGTIFIVEHNTLPIWSNLSWGVLEGWWLFNDSWRTLVPTINTANWKSIMQQANFTNVRTFTKANKYGEEMSFIGILATLN